MHVDNFFEIVNNFSAIFLQDSKRHSTFAFAFANVMSFGLPRAGADKTLLLTINTFVYAN